MFFLAVSALVISTNSAFAKAPDEKVDRKLRQLIAEAAQATLPEDRRVSLESVLARAHE